MSDVPDIRTQLLEALNRIAEGRDNAETLTKNLRKALLDFASETPDNVNCTERTEVGSVGTGVGLKLQGRKLLFSEIAYAIEDGPMPDAVKNTFPNISEHDWDAFARLTTLIYVLLERNSENSN